MQATITTSLVIAVLVRASSKFKASPYSQKGMSDAPDMSDSFDPKLGIRAIEGSLGFSYDNDVFGPVPELRGLGDIRASLRDPNCHGPDPVYGIVMDV